MIHTILFDRINGWIHFSTRTVKVCGMHMDTKRFSTYHLSMHTSGISQPVVSMNNIKFLLTSHYSGYDGVIIDFLMQVFRITTGKFHATKVVHMHVREIRIDMITEGIILLRCSVAL